MIATARLAFSHLGIYVRDLDAMEAFYTRVFGFIVTDRDLSEARRIIFLSGTPEEHHQLVLAKGRPDDVPFSLVNQISFRIESLAALQEFHAKLAEEPVSDVRPVTHAMAWSVYFRDPEGNRLEVFADSPWYVPQPYSEPLDLNRPEAEILRETEELCRGLPGCKTRAQWRTEFEARMARGA